MATLLSPALCRSRAHLRLWRSSWRVLRTRRTACARWQRGCALACCSRRARVAQVRHACLGEAGEQQGSSKRNCGAGCARAWALCAVCPRRGQGHARAVPSLSTYAATHPSCCPWCCPAGDGDVATGGRATGQAAAARSSLMARASLLAEVRPMAMRAVQRQGQRTLQWQMRGLRSCHVQHRPLLALHAAVAGVLRHLPLRRCCCHQAATSV